MGYVLAPSQEYFQARDRGAKIPGARNTSRSGDSSLGIRPGNIPGLEAPGVSVTAELLQSANHKPTELVVIYFFS
jgi:hypothetical protein